MENELRPTVYPVAWYYRYRKQARFIRHSAQDLAQYEPETSQILLEMAERLEKRFTLGPLTMQESNWRAS